MTYRNNIRVEPKNIWVAPLLGAIVSLIAFFTPIAYLKAYDGEIYMWIWGLNYIEVYGYGSEVVFTENPDLLIPSILCSIGVVISILVILASVPAYKKSTIDGRDLGHGLLRASILMLICTIVWMAAVEVVWEGYPDFWDYVDPGFGVFGLIIGSIISLMGYGISRSKGLQRQIISIPQKGISRASQQSPSPIQKQVMTQIRFCPECGNKVISDNQQFCINCGYNLGNFKE
ncbi:MAG: zinc ribbon domain-containing protein [Candidatus Thorarchaeota archaeon]